MVSLHSALLLIIWFFRYQSISNCHIEPMPSWTTLCTHRTSESSQGQSSKMKITNFMMWILTSSEKYSPLSFVPILAIQVKVSWYSVPRALQRKPITMTPLTVNLTSIIVSTRLDSSGPSEGKQLSIPYTRAMILRLQYTTLIIQPSPRSLTRDPTHKVTECHSNYKK